jgi:hypothetical protein
MAKKRATPQIPHHNAMDSPTKHISYEMLDPTKEDGRELTTDRDVAQDAYDRGFLISEHEIVTAYMTTGQKITTVLTTEWRHQ